MLWIDGQRLPQSGFRFVKPTKLPQLRRCRHLHSDMGWIGCRCCLERRQRRRTITAPPRHIAKLG